MRYYITLPGDDPKAIRTPINVLGESSFNTFYTDLGFKALTNIISKYPEVLPYTKIFDDYKNEYSVEEFLDCIKDFKIAI